MRAPLAWLGSVRRTRRRLKIQIENVTRPRISCRSQKKKKTSSSSSSSSSRQMGVKSCSIACVLYTTTMDEVDMCEDNFKNLVRAHTLRTYAYVAYSTQGWKSFTNANSINVHRSFFLSDYKANDNEVKNETTNNNACNVNVNVKTVMLMSKKYERLTETLTISE